MPERLAATDPLRPLSEMVGSGPYRFVPGEFVAGERAVYERFEGYVPRNEAARTYTAGPQRGGGGCGVADRCVAKSTGSKRPAPTWPWLARNSDITV